MKSRDEIKKEMKQKRSNKINRKRERNKVLMFGIILLSASALQSASESGTGASAVSVISNYNQTERRFS